MHSTAYKSREPIIISESLCNVRPVSYSKYQGMVPSKDEQNQLKEDLQPNSNVMILENHGLVSVGGSVEEAFLWMAQLTKACEIQWRVLRSGRDNVTTFPDLASNQPAEGDLPVELVCNPKGREYKPGELEFESYMRMLDGQGANTGYPYKTPSIYKDQMPTYYSIQHPPIVPGMEGCPSDTERSKQTSSQRSAWFKNPNPIEQQISLGSDSSGGEDRRRSPSRDPEKKRDPKQFKSFDDVIGPDSGSSHSSSTLSKRRRKKKSPVAAGSDDSDVPPPRPPLPSHHTTSASSVEQDIVEEGTVHTEDLNQADSDGSGYARVLADGRLPSKPKSYSTDSSEDGRERRGSKPGRRRSKQDNRRGSKAVESDSEGEKPGIRRGSKPHRAGERRPSETGRTGDRKPSETGRTTGDRPGDRPGDKPGTESEDEGPARPPLQHSHDQSSDSFHSTNSASEGEEDGTTVHEYIPEQMVVTEDWSEQLHSIHSSDSELVSEPSTDGHRSDEAEVQSVDSDSHSSEVVVSAPEEEDPPLIASAEEMGQVQQIKENPNIILT
eukprot:sb/3463595/